MTVVRIGTCSWADEGLIKTWYPRGVSSAAARLGYYAERFDTVEVDSPFYALPAPETAARWAERTPDGFTFHVKASGEMTGHRPADREQAFRDFRVALAPLEASGKLRGVLVQYHPRFVKSGEALLELETLRARLDPLVPLVEFRHRSWLEEGERADTLSFLERQGLAFVSVDAPATRASNVLPRLAAATHPVAYVTSTVEMRRHGTSAPNIRGSASTGTIAPRSSPSGSSRCAAWPSRRRRSTRSSTTTKTTRRPAARRSYVGCSTSRRCLPRAGSSPSPIR